MLNATTSEVGEAKDRETGGSAVNALGGGWVIPNCQRRTILPNPRALPESCELWLSWVIGEKHPKLSEENKALMKIPETVLRG